MVDKRDYVSDSEHSDKSLHLDEIGEEDKADHSEDEEFNIKSLQMQSKGQINIGEIIKKRINDRLLSERDHMASYLKF